MGKAKMIGMNKVYIPNSRADQKRKKVEGKWRGTPAFDGQQKKMAEKKGCANGVNR